MAYMLTNAKGDITYAENVIAEAILARVLSGEIRLIDSGDGKRLRLFLA